MGEEPGVPPGNGPSDAADFRRAWSGLHGQVATTGLVGVWLGVTYRLAGPLVRARISPGAVTAAALLIALAAALGAAVLDGHGRLIVGLLIGLSGLLDGLDGAVALRSGRVSARGFVADSVSDRLAEAAFGAALWFAGAPGPVALVAVGLSWLHEYTRARAAVGAGAELGVVTVAERPTRVLVAMMFLIAAGVFPSAHVLWAGAGAAGWAVLSGLGLSQLTVALARHLRVR